MRACGCDLDVIVFGHRDCRTITVGLHHEHIKCCCTHCECDCHGRQPA